ncbi:MAG: molybdenum cofactor guanylyltransferase MobA [Hyphomicrobiales bacterium]|nr:MAG: molybdenum cofactor guanylyltransferase MobA [Hyphomicrobiales bacterium]
MKGPSARAAGVVGVILAGGLSMRMGGGDKGLLDLAGRPMLAHVAARLRPQVDALIINANGDPARFAALGLTVVADTLDGFVGPLAGVLAGMRWSVAHAPAATHVLTAPADTPLVPDDTVARLSAAVAQRPQAIAIAESHGKMHPVVGLWPVALADALEDDLTRGLRKVMAWAEHHAAVAVPFQPVMMGARAVDPFFNANTPEDLAELRALMQEAAK